MPYLKGKVCLVTGASRGIGKGIAIQLALNGAKCYITGRSLETLNALKEEAVQREACGECIPIQCDHTNDDQIKAVFDQIAKENNGRLDLLVNNAYSAVNWIIEHAKKCFWDQPLDGWDVINGVGLRNHYLCAVHAARLMVRRKQGLIVNVSSAGGVAYFQTPAYGIGKAAKDRMARDCSVDLEPYNVAYVSLWPGPVRTETIEAQRKSKDQSQPKRLLWIFDHGETPEFAGKCVACLLADQNIMKRTGKILLTTDIGKEFCFTDTDGRFPVSIRSVKYVIASSGLLWLASLVPSFLKLPFSIFSAIAAASTRKQRKEPSIYA